MANTLLVKLGPKGRTVEGKPGATRIFHDLDEAHIEAGHPDAEVLVVGDRVVRAAYTPRIRQALADQLLEDVTGQEPESPTPPSVAEVLENGGALDTPSTAKPAVTAKK